MRVYELAKELGVASKDLVQVLKTAGFSVGSHMTVLDAQDIVRARAALALQKTPSVSSGDAVESVKKTPALTITQAEAKKSSSSASKTFAETKTQAETKSHAVLANSSPSSINLQSKKVDMTDPVKMTRVVGESIPQGPLHKKPVHHNSHSKPKHRDVAKASLESQEAFEEAAEVAAVAPFIDEQILEKLGTPPVVTNAKGGEKFTRIFSEAKRRPTGGRRRRRAFKGTQQEQVIQPKVVTELEITSALRVGDLAVALAKPVSDVILNLLKRGMACNINYVVQPDMIKTLAEHYGIKATIIKQQVTAEATEEQVLATRLKKVALEGVARKPIVVVMGHVDHGKTTLLDYIRKKNVAGSEKGGITQHLGAYEVESKQGSIVFLDTPGHEAFSYIRRQGSKITDIAILVIAADDGIKPQTVEAIKHAQAAEVPIIIAINKVDKIKSPAALDTIKRQLTQYDLMTEDWGGQVICVPISAKTGEGIADLLEMVVLQAQMMELRARVDVPAKVFILESHVEKGFGPVATGIVVEGILKQGDFFACGGSAGKVRLLVDSYGKRLVNAQPSVPVKIVGFSSLDNIGEWLSVLTQQEASKFKETSYLDVQQGGASTQSKENFQQFNNNAIAGMAVQRALNLILKTDTRGSKEALAGLIEKLAKDNKEINCPIRVIMSGIGDISEGDVELAMNTGAYVIGLHVKTEKNAQSFAKDKNVPVYQHDIIYHIIEFLQEELNKRKEVKTNWEKVAELVVRKVFDIKGLGVIAGCYVREGVVAKGNKVLCMRGGKQVGEGKINSLQRDKKTVKEVHTGYECGFICETYTDWLEDDVVHVMREVKAE